MNPHKSIATNILKFIQEKQQVSAKEIQNEFNVSQVTIFKHLKSLVELYLRA